MGWLSTHVLDTANGCPAANIEVSLWRVESPLKRIHLTTMRTNSDGRTDHPLLEEENFQEGIYEIVFGVGEYFMRLSKGRECSVIDSFPFLDAVPIRFGVSDSSTHYHVPLLVSPWSYSTYRGS